MAAAEADVDPSQGIRAHQEAEGGQDGKGPRSQGTQELTRTPPPPRLPSWRQRSPRTYEPQQWNYPFSDIGVIVIVIDPIPCYVQVQTRATAVSLGEIYGFVGAVTTSVLVGKHHWIYCAFA